MISKDSKDPERTGDFANHDTDSEAGLDPEKQSVPVKKESFLKALGPGVITGAADDDPSGIATYAQAGAQLGLTPLWLALFQFPMAAAVQEICARIGLVTGAGLASAIKQRYSKRIVYILATILLVTNTINIGADLGAMAASTRLLFPQIPYALLGIGFAILILFAQIVIPYHKYVKILKYLSLSLFAYLVTAVLVGGDATKVLYATFVPSGEFNWQFAKIFVALFGTSISPYLFFWQASEVAEENVRKGKTSDIGKGTPKVSLSEIKSARSDVLIGMAFSQLIMWAIIVTTANSLHASGVTNISSADQAAQSIEPLVKGFPNAGLAAKTIFALGIIGTGLLAIPVLAGSSGYALAEAFGWKQGLSKKFRNAKAFYLVIAAATAIGLWINFSGINPIDALIYASIVNAFASIPILLTVMRISNDKRIMRNRTNGRLSNVIGWTTLGTMGFAVILLVASWFQS